MQRPLKKNRSLPLKEIEEHRREIFYALFLCGVIVALMFGIFGRQDKTDMWLLVGLGNPGKEYAAHRHNIGFMVVDRIADEYGLGPFRSKFQGEMSEGKIDGEKVILLKPQTYMNESGQSVIKAAKFFKIPPERTVVFHDELDLAPSDVRVKTGGGNAGHNGLKSLQAHLGTPDFVRVRMGIGHPGDKHKVSPYVLSDFAKTEQDWVERVVEGAAKNVALLLQEKNDEFMGQVVPQDE